MWTFRECNKNHAFLNGSLWVADSLQNRAVIRSKTGKGGGGGHDNGGHHFITYQQSSPLSASHIPGCFGVRGNGGGGGVGGKCELCSRRSLY